VKSTFSRTTDLKREAKPQRGKRHIAWDWVTLGIVLLLIAMAGAVQMLRNPKSSISRVVIGTKDEVYYSSGATMRDALVLGHALQNTGFFNGRGSSVLLSKQKGVSVVSFVLNAGGWDHDGTIAGFEEIGRRIATSIGGFPIEIHLVDSDWSVRKAVVVGKTVVGAKDIVYYLGTATERDAKALGQALRDAKYLEDLGVTVVVSKGGGSAIGFVVDNSVWDRPEAVAAFQNLAREVAPSIGGLPVQLRLLNADMETKKEVAVQ
jgi:hypothetical protein